MLGFMYDLELEKLIEVVKKNKYKRVLIQLPDGLKPKAKDIVDILSENGCQVFIWFSSCFGGCDIPVGLQNLKVDLFVQFGHNQFVKEDSW